MTILIPCWNFADYLRETLPAWLDLTKDVAVVTHPKDWGTHEVAGDFGVRVVATEGWEQDHAKVNKAAALDRAIDALGVVPGAVLVAVDADVRPLHISSLPADSDVQPDVIYGCRRYNLNGQFEQVANIPYIVRRGRGDAPEACGGYFQLFRYDPRRRFGSYPTAAAYDYDFAFRFPKGVTLDNIGVIHLGERHKHWEGRVR